MDVSLLHYFVKYLYQILLRVDLIFSSAEGVYIGMKLIFEGELDLIIVNFGDEINVLEFLSLLYEKDEGIIYKYF